MFSPAFHLIGWWQVTIKTAFPHSHQISSRFIFFFSIFYQYFIYFLLNRYLIRTVLNIENERELGRWIEIDTIHVDAIRSIDFYWRWVFSYSVPDPPLIDRIVSASKELKKKKKASPLFSPMFACVYERERQKKKAFKMSRRCRTAAAGKEEEEEEELLRATCWAIVSSLYDRKINDRLTHQWRHLSTGECVKRKKKKKKKKRVDLN